MGLTSTQMQEFIDQNPPIQELPRRQNTSTYNGQSQRLDVSTYLSKYGVEFVGEKQHGDCILYLLKQCVFDPSHTQKEAAISQDANGVLRYKCFHNSCSDKRWTDARKIISGDDPLFDGTPNSVRQHPTAQAYQHQPEDWPDPLPIKSELPPVEQIIEEMIPEPFRAWVIDAADRMQIPPDFIIAPLLVVCGSIIGTSCLIRPKQKDDWSVTPNLWGGIVGPPSMLKTPALTEAVNKTLGRLEVAAREEHAEKIRDHEANAVLDGARIKATRAAIGKAAKLDRDGKNKGKSLEELAGELKELQSCETPTERRYKTNDSSIEKIVELLEQNPRGLLYFRDELIGLFKRTERTGNEQDRAFLLESWNGDGSHTDDRIGRGTVRCDNLCISLLGGIQPDKISGYLHGAINEGDNDGFVQRLQLMVYPDPAQKWQYQDKKPDTGARNRAYDIIKNLAAMTIEGEDIFEQPYLRFSEEGQEIFKQWLTLLETKKLKNQDEHPVMLEHLAKYRSLMPSLALIFHLIEAADIVEQPGLVSTHAAVMAAAWCQYLESHARRIYSLVLDAGQAGGSRLAEKIKAGELGTEFTRPELVRKKWAMLTKKHLAQEAIDHLVNQNWLREIIPGPRENQGGRPAATKYQVNPKIFSIGTEQNAPKPLKPV